MLALHQKNDESGQKIGDISGQIGPKVDSSTYDHQNITSDHSGQIQVVRKTGMQAGEENRMRIIEAMRSTPDISRRQLSELIGISQSAIQKHIDYLKKANVIVRVGSDRKGLWKVIDLD